MLDQQKVWWQWLQKQKNIYKSILHLSTESPKWNYETQKYKAKNYLFKCFGILLSCQSKLNTNPLSIWIFYTFFIVSEKLSKLSIPLNNTKLTMFYTFHKNWQCVKSASNCFCFWSLYIFLGNLLCIQSWNKSKNQSKFFKRYYNQFF